jgi:hypothetical protein
MYDISDYTFAPYKVVWMDVSATMKATVIANFYGNEMPMPEHKLILLTTNTADEAFYVSAVLNSDPVNTVISGYIVDNSVSTHPIKNITIPKFDAMNALHARLGSLSQDAHQAAARGNWTDVTAAENAIDQIALELW